MEVRRGGLKYSHLDSQNIVVACFSFRCIMELTTGLGGTIEILQDRVLRLLDARPTSRRILIALSGVPGSGKSTIAAALLAQLKHTGIKNAVIVPMVRN